MKRWITNVKTLALGVSAVALSMVVGALWFDVVASEIGLDYRQHLAGERAYGWGCMAMLALGALACSAAAQEDEGVAFPVLAGVQVVLIVLMAGAKTFPSGMVT